MNISKSTYELLLPIIAAMDKTLVIQSVTTISPGVFQLSICNTKWATLGFDVTIHGDPYHISSVDTNSSITVTGAAAPLPGYFDLYAPKFYHGTISATESDLNAKTPALKSSDKLPMIWLHEPVDETNDMNDENAIARESVCDFFFMVDADFAGWTNEQHFTMAIKPMRQMLDEFYKAIERSGTVNADIIPHLKTNDLPRFGRYTAYSTQKTTIFAQYEMSGVKMNITLPFIRSSKTCC